jgi:hypothetical protein
LRDNGHSDRYNEQNYHQQKTPNESQASGLIRVTHPHPPLYNQIEKVLRRTGNPAYPESCYLIEPGRNCLAVGLFQSRKKKTYLPLRRLRWNFGPGSMNIWNWSVLCRLSWLPQHRRIPAMTPSILIVPRIEILGTNGITADNQSQRVPKPAGRSCQGPSGSHAS